MNTDKFSGHVEDSAKALAGNHLRFESFGWHDAPEDSENWCIIYTSNRDSGLLDKSNEHVINEVMGSKAFEKDVRFESHGHWAVGHVDGMSVRVYDAKGDITPAFKALHELACSLADYPVLSDEDYSRREYEATIENIESVGHGLVSDDAPESWASEAFSWFWDNDQSAVENRDDQGGYPSDDQMRDALEALGYLAADE